MKPASKASPAPTASCTSTGSAAACSTRSPCGPRSRRAPHFTTTRADAVALQRSGRGGRVAQPGERLGLVEVRQEDVDLGEQAARRRRSWRPATGRGPSRCRASSERPRARARASSGSAASGVSDGRLKSPTRQTAALVGDARPELLDERAVEHALAGEVRDERALAVGPHERDGDRRREVGAGHDRADVDPARRELVADRARPRGRLPRRRRRCVSTAEARAGRARGRPPARRQRSRARLPTVSWPQPGSAGTRWMIRSVGEVPDDADGPVVMRAITAMWRHRWPARGGP